MANPEPKPEKKKEGEERREEGAGRDQPRSGIVGSPNPQGSKNIGQGKPEARRETWGRSEEGKEGTKSLTCCGETFATRELYDQHRGEVHAPEQAEAPVGV